MPWNDYPLTTLTIPGNAGPADPRIVITSAPPESIGYPVDAAILFYFNETDYFYIGVSGFGGGTFATFTRGLVSETTGDQDTFEEVSWGNTARNMFIDTVVADHLAGQTTHVTVSGQQIEDHTDLLLHGRPGVVYETGDQLADMPHALVDLDTSQTTTAGFTTTETVVATLVGSSSNNDKFSNERKYKVEFTGQVRSGNTADRVAFRIRQDSAAGTILRNCGEVTIAVGGVVQPVDFWAIYTGRGLDPETVVLTAVRSSGVGTITYTPGGALAMDIVTDSVT